MQLPVNDLQHVLDHTATLFEELRGQRIFITGGTGFFGAWLLESFACANRQLALNASVSLLTRDRARVARKFPHLVCDPAICLVEGDIRTFEFPPGEFPFVIHAATEASASLVRDNPRLMLSTIVDGTRRALDFAAQASTRRFLLTSSGAVYGRQPASLTHVPEDYYGAPDPCDPRSVYGEGKRLAELDCALAARDSGLQCLIARCFAFVGPQLPLDIHFAIGNFIRDGLAGSLARIQGDGTPFRSYLYAADLAIWLWTILFRGASCRPYNVGSEQDLSIADLAARVDAVLGVDPPVPRGRPEASLGRGPERYVPNTARARQELGLREFVSLDAAIRSTAEWYREERSSGS